MKVLQRVSGHAICNKPFHKKQLCALMVKLSNLESGHQSLPDQTHSWVILNLVRPVPVKPFQQSPDVAHAPGIPSVSLNKFI